MRPEYFEAARYRRWHELELYARKRPNQALADMVYELAETIGDKADRKALRKVLWILKQAGFEPAEEPSEPKAQPQERLPYRLLGAVMGFPGSHGYQMLIAHVEHSGKSSNLFMEVNDRWGYVVAKETKGDLRLVRAAMDNMIEKANRLAVEADPTWVISRMAASVRNKKPDVPRDVPLKLPGLWKRIFERTEDLPHPSTKMVPTPQTADQRGDLLLNLEHIQHWRLSLHPGEEVWTAIHAIRWDEDRSQEEREVALIEALIEHKADLFRDEVVQDLSQRQRDAAYILDAAGDARGTRLLSIAHEFGMRREESDFANWIMGGTALDINSNLDQDDFDPSGDGEASWA